VVLVEDNPDAAETLRELLELWGHDARVAHSGEEGVALLRSTPADMILLDIGLPDIDGYEVARRLRAGGLLRSARLVALTGYGQAEDRTRSREAGFDRHLTKPVNPQELELLLREA
jgi:CheY-like chemotaxis protein